MENELLKGTVFFSVNPIPLLLLALTVGMITGFLRDISALFCRLSGENRAAIFFADLFSVLFAYSALFVCALNKENGVLRWYHIALAGIGLSFYRTVFSSLVQKILFFLLDRIKRLLHFLFLPLLFLIGRTEKNFERLKKQSLLHKKKRQYKTAKKQWLRLAARGFDCIPPRAGNTLS